MNIKESMNVFNCDSVRIVEMIHDRYVELRRPFNTSDHYHTEVLRLELEEINAIINLRRATELRNVAGFLEEIRDKINNLII